MLRLLKNNTFRLVFAGLAMILVAMITFLPGAFAADIYEYLFDANPSTEMLQDGTLMVNYKLQVKKSGKYNNIYGFFNMVNEQTLMAGCGLYYTTTTFERGADLPEDATVSLDITTGEYSISSDSYMEFSAGDELINAVYALSSEAPLGLECVALQYGRSFSIDVDGDIEEYIDNGNNYSGINVGERQPQNLIFGITELGKTYGDDDFTVSAGMNGGGPVIVYSSSDESVATVNSSTAEVHIVGAGTADIIATAPPYYYFEETSTSYTLNVNSKEISIVNATVPDKTYDGTTNSEVGTVTLSDQNLIQGVDYTASAVLDDANVGNDRTATVTVTLIGDAANNYVFDTDTFTVNNVTISPYTITSDNIDLEYYLTRYSGVEKEPGVTVSIGTFTVDSNEYTVGYEDNIDIGTATVTVTAKDNMNIVSSASKTFEIIDRDVLEITGIATPQTLTYTGDPVILQGTLTVGDNTDGITVDDLATVWYVYRDGGWVITTQPVTVGIYKVIYSYSGVNYVGELEVNFEIEQATSPEPAEASEEFSIEAGKRLSEIGGTRTRGFSWDDEDTIIQRGRNTYLATYVYNDDSVNYTTLHIRIIVDGLYDPEPTPVDPDTGGDEEVIVVPDTGRFTSTRTGAGGLASAIGITIISSIAIFLISTMILDKKLARNKINFDKK